MQVLIILTLWNYHKISLGLEVINNKYKLVQHHCHYDVRKFNFTNRVVPIWNSLSNHVVSADTVNTFKNRLDKFWLNQEVIFNYKADLTGTGKRSIIN